MFYVEYFRFEAVFLQKIKQRREVLTRGKDEDIDFVDNEKEEEMKQTTMDTSEKLLEIVLDQIKTKFGDNFLVFVAIWK